MSLIIEENNFRIDSLKVKVKENFNTVKIYILHLKMCL